jgi:hypothetical protein
LATLKTYSRDALITVALVPGLTLTALQPPQGARDRSVANGRSWPAVSRLACAHSLSSAEARAMASSK